MVGYSQEELLKLNVKDLFPPEDLVKDPIQNDDLRAGKTIIKERKLVRKNGTFLLVEVSGKMLDDGRVQVIARDITERKKAEEKLKESEEKYRTLIESSSDCICHIDLNGKIMYMNRGGVKINEFESSDYACGLDCATGIKEKYLDLMKDAINRAKHGKTTNLEYESTNVKGKDLWWESTVGPIKDNKNNVKSIIRISRDITVRKKAEEALRTRERQLAASQKVARLGSWEWDLLKNEIIWSDELYDIFRMDPKDFDGTYDAFLKMVHPDDKELLDSAVNISWREKIPYNVDARMVCPDGTEWVMQARGEVTHDESGNPIFMEGTAQDITDLKKAENELKKAYEDLKELDRMKDEFLQNVTHELRTPITVMLTTTRMIKESIDDKRLKEIFKLNEKSTWRLDRLVGSIMDYSSIENGTREIKEVTVDIADVIDEVVLNTQDNAKAKGIWINIEKLKKPSKAIGDRDAIYSIFFILISNAIKFNKEGGSVTISSKIGKDFIELSVADTGIGIPKEVGNKVFERFYQVDGSTTRRFEGTGIGLALAKKYVELLKGNIWVEDNPGGGSIFYVSIPLTD